MICTHMVQNKARWYHFRPKGLKKTVGDFFCLLYGNMIKLYLILLFHFAQNELFEKAKNEILDEVISLTQVTPKHWYGNFFFFFFFIMY